MPRKTVSKRTAETVETEKPSEVGCSTAKERCCSKLLIPFVLIAVIAGLLAFRYKEYFVAALVNGKPIFRHELNQRMASVFGKETLENLLVEKLILEEAGKQKIVVSEAEIDAEIAKISQNLGSETKIEDVLKLQGVSLKDFRQQLEMKLAVNKILEKDISISGEEIEAFLKENKDRLTATGEAEARLKEQKIAEKVQSWITGLLTNAKISRFLK